ncbi:LOW QUALITY PROTEIN: interferon-inducible GTPase 5-like [Pelodytes ibericus]
MSCAADPTEEDCSGILCVSGGQVNVTKASKFIADSIPEEEFKDIKDAFEKGDMFSATEKVKKALQNINSMPVNIAVMGDPTSGKIPFISGMLGRDDHVESLSNIEGKDPTEEPAPHAHLRLKNVKYWDLPPASAPDFMMEDYLQKVHFSQYEMVVFFSSDLFTEHQIQVAKEVEAMKKFCFVRSNIDSDLDESRTNNPESCNEKSIMKGIRKKCVRDLKERGIKDPNVFLLSSNQLNRYDFDLLEKALEKGLPLYKKHTFVLSLPNVTPKILEKKRSVLSKMIIWATLSCAVSSVPLPGLSVACDVPILVKAIKGYLKHFGLDKKSLAKLENKSGKSASDVRSLMQSPLVKEEINHYVITTKLNSSGRGAFTATKSFLSMIPMFGSLAAGAVSFGTTYSMLLNFLKEIKEDAGRLLKACEDSG